MYTPGIFSARSGAASKKLPCISKGPVVRSQRPPKSRSFIALSQGLIDSDMTLWPYAKISNETVNLPLIDDTATRSTDRLPLSGVNLMSKSEAVNFESSWHGSRESDLIILPAEAEDKKMEKREERSRVNDNDGRMMMDLFLCAVSHTRSLRDLRIGCSSKDEWHKVGAPEHLVDGRWRRWSESGRLAVKLVNRSHRSQQLRVVCEK